MKAVRFAVVFLATLSAALVAAAPAHAADGSSIAGTVTDRAGAPLQNICVSAEAADSSGDLWSNGWAQTDANGAYVIDSLNAGDYKLGYTDCNYPQHYLSQYYKDKPNYDSADLVTVPDQTAVSGIDVSLDLGGTITGRLTDPSGAGIDTCVDLYTDQDGLVNSTWSDSGAYSFTALPAGTYMVNFARCSSTPPPVQYVPAAASSPARASGTQAPMPAPAGYLQQWYDGAQDEGTATPVTVDLGQTVSGIDGVLHPAAGIAGEVDDANGNPLSGICVSAFTSAWSGSATTGSEGQYEIDGLPGGNYVVSFGGCGDPWQQQYFSGARTAKRATPVTATEGTLTDHIDAALVKRPRPDAAVTSLKVADDTITADGIPVADSPFRRTVTVGIANLGTADAVGSVSCTDYDCFSFGGVSVHVWAQMRTDGSVTELGTEEIDLVAGATATRSYTWDGSGSIGDADVYAQVCTSDDSNAQNDLASARHYVGVGGTGFGYKIQVDHPGPSSCAPAIPLG